jgi:prephenate dehydrogenase
MLIMDVGSTKRDVIDSARRVLRDHIGSFVPCHPIAGKEVAGVEHADADLYGGKHVILTPIERTKTVQLKLAVQLWETLGCRVEMMAPEAHDAAFAAVSHLPHMIAFAMIHAITGQEHGSDFLSLAGPGFRDFTRIAASEPKIWRDILLANRQELLVQAALFRQALQAMEAMVESGDAEALEAGIEKASRIRAQWRMGASRK